MNETLEPTSKKSMTVESSKGNKQVWIQSASPSGDGTKSTDSMTHNLLTSAVSH